MPDEAATAAGAGAWATDTQIAFRYADPDNSLSGVRLLQEVRIPADRLDFRRAGEHWELLLDRPQVSRMEYLLELRYPDGGTKVGTDPANPRQVAGAFGPKSVLEFPGYAPPRWLSGPADPGQSVAFEVPALDAVISVRIWAPAGTQDAEPLPLLVVHDGPEYDSLASLTRYLGAGTASGRLPRLRAALLSPGQRNDWYSANPRYARALRHSVLPDLVDRLMCTSRIGMGTSLGGLAMLHAQCRYPDSFDALFLQSGSFFLPRFDSQERRFPYYRRITKFSAAVHGSEAGVSALPGRPVPAVLTCGAVEENIENNRVMAHTLASHGYPAELHELSDMHNYTAWRDAFDPYLSALLQRVGS